MPMLVEALVVRTMKATAGFVRADPAVSPPSDCPSVVANETVIGWYENPPPHESCRLFFTTKAIWVVSPASAVKILLREITSWKTDEKKRDVSGVSVKAGAQWHFVPCAGRRGPGGKFMDAFDLATMLNVVVSASTGAFPA
jgi:hypothetical protein